MKRLKVHCILPSSPWLADSKTNIPLGVLYIAAILRENGHDVCVTSRLNFRANDPYNWSAEALACDVHMLGFCSPQMNESIDIATDLRAKCPGALIVAGGPHPSYEPLETVQAVSQGEHPNVVLKQRRDYSINGMHSVGSHPVFDTAVEMEGEMVIMQLLEDWQNGCLKKIYKGDKALLPNLDVVPFPAWDLLPFDHIYNDGVAVMKTKYFPNDMYPTASGAVLSLIGTRGCPYRCFGKGTPVLMADGSERNIEDLRVNDYVMSVEVSSGRLTPQRVTAVGVREADDLYEAEFSDGTKEQVTGDHPYWTENGWKEILHLQGVELTTVQGVKVIVSKLTFLGQGVVYPITVEKHENFIVHGKLVHNCTYCSTPWIGQPPRYRSSHNIITEMAKAMDMGVRMFKFQDDTYTLHKTKLRELATDIHSAFGEGSFAARIHTRVNTMDDHVAESLRLMNCKVTCFGIESGSQKVLDANWKGTKVKQNTDALKKAKEYGFFTIAFLVAGLAGETADTAKETQDWLLTVKPYLDSCNLAVGIPYPGSRFWSHPKESGIEILDYNYDHQWIVGFSARNEILVRPHGTTYDEMMQMKSDMFQFLRTEGWAKAEWDEDNRIQKIQDQFTPAM